MRASILAVVGAASVALTACAHTPEPVIRTVTVRVPVVTSCIPATLDAPPLYPDSTPALRAAAGPADRYQLLAAGRELRIYRLNELEALVAACR